MASDLASARRDLDAAQTIMRRELEEERNRAKSTVATQALEVERANDTARQARARETALTHERDLLSTELASARRDLEATQAIATEAERRTAWASQAIDEEVQRRATAVSTLQQRVADLEIDLAASRAAESRGRTLLIELETQLKGVVPILH